jgi:cell division inhibitor SepF
MSFLDGIKKLAQPYDEEDDIEYADDEELEDLPEEEPERTRTSRTRSSEPDTEPSSYARTRREAPSARSSDGGVFDIRSSGASKSTGTDMKVVLFEPKDFEAAAEIADHLRSRHPVLMNLEGAPSDVSRRLVDFLSGVAYALEGKIKRVASKTYFIAPYNVNLMIANNTDSAAASGTQASNSTF